MNPIDRIHEIADEHFDQEMDSWYYGPCDQIFRIAQNFNDTDWTNLIESIEQPKPDMWRVFIAHSFLDHENSIGRSEELVLLLYIKCIDPDNAYFIVQYVEEFEWEKVPLSLLRLFISKLRQMKTNWPIQDRPYLEKLVSDVSAYDT